MFNGPEVPMSILFLSLAAIFVLRGPLGRALGDRLAGRLRSAAEDHDIQELKELRREVEELHHLPEQLSELGERVDFLERLVAKQREAEPLPPVR